MVRQRTDEQKQQINQFLLNYPQIASGFNQYIARLGIKNSPDTGRSYQNTIYSYFIYLTQTKQEIGHISVNEYLKKRAVEQADTSVRQGAFALVAFFEYLEILKILEPNSAKLIDIPPFNTERPFNPPFLLKEDIAKLIRSSADTATVTNEGPNNLIWPNMIALGYDAALRWGEAEMVELEKFDFANNRLNLKRLKNKSRPWHWISLKQETMDLVKQYSSKIRPKSDSDKLFLIDIEIKTRKEHHIRPLSGNEERLFGNICKDLGIENKANPKDRCTWHILRHSAIIHRIIDGEPIPLIAKHVGHQNINTTYGYFNSDIVQRMRPDLSKQFSSGLV